MTEAELLVSRCERKEADRRGRSGARRSDQNLQYCPGGEAGGKLVEANLKEAN